MVGALDAYTAGIEQRIDLARVNDRVFVNNASLGVYAKVVQSQAYRDAKLRDVGGDAARACSVPRRPRSTSGSPARTGSLRGRPAGAGVEQPVSAHAHERDGHARALDEGALGVFAARVRGPADASRFVALELAGQVARFPGLMTWSATDVRGPSARPVEVGLDGEALVMEPPLRFASMPGALRVRTPRAPASRPRRAASR